MALDKHQIRQVAALAREEDIPREEALERLFPDEVDDTPRAPRKAPAKKVSTAKEPETAV